MAGELTIVDDAIGAAEIIDESVGSDEIVDGSITSNELGSDSVEADEIAAGAVGADEIATDAVGSDEIIDGSVTSNELGTDSVEADEIAAGAVGASEILDDSVGSAEIADNAITTSELASNSVEADEIAQDAVGSSEIADDAVGTSELDLAMSPTWTGTHDFGGGSVEIPNSTSISLDTTGQMAIKLDGTNEGLRFYASNSTRALTYRYSKSMIIESPVDADNLLMWQSEMDITILSVTCIVDPGDAGDSIDLVVYQSDDATGTFTNKATNGVDATALTCDNDGATNTSFSNGSVTAGKWIGVDFDAAPVGTVDKITITVRYAINP